ncbi:hypothetical protein PVK06_034898 [Gossypium arboreum]|uniref:Uncharacterized protein n=1 Tax=Gossypium arboreum TaxID=29729 RepID=A0ABR0NHM9_GOSAR|nr:hypothetical protein PVK06_034898 [Gossypium arboreum]
MKEMISAKTVRYCGRRILKLFYKFPVLTDPIKFIETELVDNKDMETMVSLYCGNQGDQNIPIHLFAELAGVEPTEDPTPLGEKHGAQESCMMIPVSYVDSQLTVRGIDINLNIAPKTDVVGDDVYNSSDPSDHKVDSDSDPDMDEVPRDIDDESVNNDGNVNVSSIGNQIQNIVIHNNPREHMSLIDFDAAHAVQFPGHLEILLAQQLAVGSNPEELFRVQRFKSKENCIFSIKRYNMNISVDYNVAVSKLILYIGECWRLAEGYNWWVRAAFI